tara:strand:- start:123 stop:512 length:390 start_codon:yes stop_codon:yes gene_type:complete
MASKPVKKPVGRPPKSGSPYMQLSRAMANVFDKTIDKVGGADAIAELLVEEMTEKGKVLEVLKVVQSYLPRQHSVDMEVSGGDALSTALSAVASRLSDKQAERLNNPETIEAEYEEVSRNDEADLGKGE